MSRKVPTPASKRESTSGKRGGNEDEGWRNQLLLKNQGQSLPVRGATESVAPVLVYIVIADTATKMTDLRRFHCLSRQKDANNNNNNNGTSVVQRIKDSR